MRRFDSDPRLHLKWLAEERLAKLIEQLCMALCMKKKIHLRAAFRRANQFLESCRALVGAVIITTDEKTESITPSILTKKRGRLNTTELSEMGRLRGGHPGDEPTDIIESYSGIGSPTSAKDDEGKTAADWANEYAPQKIADFLKARQQEAATKRRATGRWRPLSWSQNQPPPSSRHLSRTCQS